MLMINVFKMTVNNTPPTKTGFTKFIREVFYKKVSVSYHKVRKTKYDRKSSTRRFIIKKISTRVHYTVR